MKSTLVSSCLAVLLAALSSPAALAQDEDAALRAIEGFHNQTFRPIIGMAGQPASDSAAYRSNSGSYNCGNTAAGGDRVVRYPFTVPNVRNFQFVRIWGTKMADTADTTFRLRRTCMDQDNTVPATVILGTATVTTTDGPFSAVLFGDPDSPLNLNCRYWVEAEFGSSAQPCGPTSTSLRLERIRVQSLLTERIFRGTFRQYTP